MSYLQGVAKKALRKRYEPLIRRTIHSLGGAVDDLEPSCSGLGNGDALVQQVVRGIVESSGSEAERKTLTLIEEVLSEVIVKMREEEGHGVETGV